MPGKTSKFTSTGTGTDARLSDVLLGTPDPRPQFAISVRAYSGNAGSIMIGRQAAIEPFAANDSRTYYSCRMEELVVNDGGTSGLILYIDESGPMDPQAQYSTVVQANPWSFLKAPNDPTP